ncbi:hypothetical protein [Streptomyces clavuligerus]|uniref:Uncharacterized protein n=2 Tax=Streptomyces clavuligerus TaxID=1901 RepID=B5GYP8_STRCL|nr:hypothetical protein [Streptomyces clavuligerus]ANW22567.1 hypothetical protein BB341_30120 [Streptomyces clavuligerus]AXU16955.1 hypothetical protein D1794_29900 [Streptomyces clavuligerus]AXU17451.1 hypothetical protein D1794_33275 [Streptomyces clavuligerus]EDY51444.1 hypothetical protein SSCG_04649 [Streptomyces clavuligerus]EFG04696.1 Hypothetical protein SCLAV_p1210 [Streptomyces clavuligerus]
MPVVRTGAEPTRYSVTTPRTGLDLLVVGRGHSDAGGDGTAGGVRGTPATADAVITAHRVSARSPYGAARRRVFR